MKQHQDVFTIRGMCEVFGVSTSGYYAWLERPVSKRAQRNEVLTEKIKIIHTDRRATYGSPRVHSELIANGEQVCENTVAKIMRQEGIRSNRVKRFTARTTDSRHGFGVAPNTLDQDFTAQRRNEKWVSDITYLETSEGWMYLAVVLDLYSRKVVGWSMSEHLRAELAIAALDMAVMRRGTCAGVLHHSDRGVQYASREYQGRLLDNEMKCSMSRTGNCYDNAAVESFFSSMKSESVYQKKYATREEARRDVFEYIEVFYNRVRRHSALGYVSPEAFEAA